MIRTLAFYLLNQLKMGVLPKKERDELITRCIGFNIIYIMRNYLYLRFDIHGSYLFTKTL